MYRDRSFLTTCSVSGGKVLVGLFNLFMVLTVHRESLFTRDWKFVCGKIYLVAKDVRGPGQMISPREKVCEVISINPLYQQKLDHDLLVDERTFM